MTLTEILHEIVDALSNPRPHLHGEIDQLEPVPEPVPDVPVAEPEPEPVPVPEPAGDTPIYQAVLTGPAPTGAQMAEPVEEVTPDAPAQ